MTPIATLSNGLLTVTIGGHSTEIIPGEDRGDDAISDMAIDALGRLGYGPDDVAMYVVVERAIRRAVS